MKKLVLIAGNPSHGPGMHEHRAGMLLLGKCLDGYPGLEVSVHDHGWVASEDVLDAADAVAIFSDGGQKHPLLVDDHLATIERMVGERNTGFGLMHFAVELPEGRPADLVDGWIGGHYADKVSCNPIWEADFEQFPVHPAARGVTQFATRDEWYINIQFTDAGVVTPILVATPSDAVREGPYVYPHGPYPHIVAASGRPETLMWAFERPDGGRGFGLNGAHFHANWGTDSFRTAALDALVWISGLEVPSGGVQSSVTEEDLAKNLDEKLVPA